MKKLTRFCNRRVSKKKANEVKFTNRESQQNKNVTRFATEDCENSREYMT